MSQHPSVFFAPELLIQNGVTDISFYERGFGATELRRFSNDDGTIHVSELSINGTIFHLHEHKLGSTCFSPQKHNGTTVKIGIFVEDVDAFISRAVRAGAVIVSPAQDYDYGYRQGDIRDPFGHIWMVEKKI